jgi:hypothetical protein
MAFGGLLALTLLLLAKFDLLDPNTSNPSTMEFGFGFFRAKYFWHYPR